MSVNEPEEGRIVPPYPRDTCQADNCGHQKLNQEVGAYLHRNRETGGFVILCGSCSLTAQMNDSLRFPLVPL